MGSSEIRTPPRSPRTDLSSDKTISQELIATISPTPTTTSQDRSKPKPTSSKTKEKRKEMSDTLNNLVLETNELTKEAVPRMVNDAVKKDRKISTTNVPELIYKNSLTSTSTFADLQHQLYLNMRTNLQDQVDDLELWDVLKLVNLSKQLAQGSKTSASARQEKQQEWDTWVKDTVIDKDEVIPEDKTPELIEEFQNVDKHVPTIFDHERIKATLRDMMSNQFKDAEEYAYHLEKLKNYMENQIVWEIKQEDIRRSKPYAHVFYGPQRNPNEPPRQKLLTWFSITLALVLICNTPKSGLQQNVEYPRALLHRSIAQEKRTTTKRVV
ncbi:hypothetical protein Tco_0881496 [Tanacetum coccineum]